jgi:hypothetical protein
MDITLLYLKLEGSVIGAELDIRDHGSIPRNCDQKGLKPLDARTDL